MSEEEDKETSPSTERPNKDWKTKVKAATGAVRMGEHIHRYVSSGDVHYYTDLFDNLSTPRVLRGHDFFGAWCFSGQLHPATETYQESYRV